MYEFSDFCNKLLEILDERGGSYGVPENSFEHIVLYWIVYLDKIITETDVAIMMMLLKIARETERHKDDNFLDIAGYAACAACLNKKRIKKILFFHIIMFLNFHRGKLTDKIQQALCFKRAFLFSRRKE